MKVSLTELARSYYSRHFSAFPLQLLPFALQRFMQGRQFRIPIKPKKARRTSKQEIEVRVVLWSFAWSSTSGESSEEIPWIPIWYRLPLPDDKDKEIEELSLCHNCLPSLKLASHPLFIEGQGYVRDIAKQSQFHKESKPILLDVPEDISLKDLSFLTEKGHRLTLWRGRTQEIHFDDHGHTFEVLALLEDVNPSEIPRLSEITKNEEMADAFAKHLLEAVNACQAILSGVDPDSEPEVVATLPFTPRKASRVRPPTGQKEAPKSAAELVDRLIETLRDRVASKVSLEFHPLSVLFIVRCGEPVGQTQTAAHARFLLGREQAQALREKVEELYESKELIPSLQIVAKNLRDQGTELPKIVDALKKLGFVFACDPQQDSEIGNLFDDSSCWGDQGRQEVVESICRAFMKSFPVRTVVSNRVMGHGSCEEVHQLYESRALHETVGEYPIDLLLAEQVLLPDELKECLFYGASGNCVHKKGQIG